jgi:hypothetical protein
MVLDVGTGTGVVDDQRDGSPVRFVAPFAVVVRGLLVESRGVLLERAFHTCE